ncbi:MAG: hypothetical protein CBE48_002600 [Flavobacteriales bacterium TMED288]|nr:hypothetical protein [Flavobacteriales bacterium]RPG52989.1 MAG: hypothetical protein CBE48_002600 [Flavobacteriales bacterium TMED288]
MLKLNKVAILVKTSLQFDGRVISQIDNLSKNFKNTEFRIFLLSDGPFDLSFNNNCHVDEISLITRRAPKSSLFQLFKVIEFGFKAFLKIKKFDPDILHVHDDTACFGAIFYKLFFSKKIIIYDDHELKYVRPKSFNDKISFLIEKFMYKISNIIIVANYERKRLASVIYNNKNIIIHENYFFNRQTNKLKNSNLINLEKKINLLRSENKKIILHQGQITEIRGSKDIVLLVNNLPENFKVLLIGINYYDYQKFLKIINKSKKNVVVFGGFIDYHHIKEVYKIIDYCLIIYKNLNLNNKYCAPNRVYLAYYFGKPIIANKENPVLSDFVKKTGCGTLFDVNSNLELMFNLLQHLPTFTDQLYLKNDINPKKIVDVYNKLIKA